MAETKEAAPAATGTPGNIVSAGRPELGVLPTFQPKTETAEAAPNAAENGAAEKINSETPTNGQAAAEIVLPEVTDEQLQKILENKGIKGFENFDTLKSLTEKAAQPAKAEPTKEEKEKNEKAFEKRMLDYFVEKGGTPEDFVALKTIAAADLKLLSDSEIRRELKAGGFDEDQIKLIVAERYYQLNPDELEQGVDETEEDFEKRKEFKKKLNSYYTPKLENRNSYMKVQAENALKGLREAIAAEDMLKQQEIEFSSKVEEHSKTLPRKITFEMGELNGAKLEPVSYDVSDADVTEVVSLLKDTAKRNQFLFNPDNSLNLTNLMDSMLGKKVLESAVKAALLEGGNRQVAIFEKTFPGTPHDLGVGGQKSSGTNTGRKGVLVSAGKPEIGKPEFAVRQ